MKTCLCVAIGIAGFALSISLGHFAPDSLSENLLGTLIGLSSAMIIVGFIPAICKWPGARAALVVMCIVSAVIFAHLAVSVIVYALDEARSNGQQAAAQREPETISPERCGQPSVFR